MKRMKMMAKLTDKEQLKRIVGNLLDERITRSIVQLINAGLLSVDEARELIGLPAIERTSK